MILTAFEQWWALWRSQHERADAGECVIAVRDFYEACLATAHAAAISTAGQHCPMIAIDDTASKVWVYCSCGFNRDSTTYATDPDKWTEHILALTPATAQRLYDLRIAEAVRDKLQSIHNYDWKNAEKGHDCSLGIYKICSELASASAEVERLRVLVLPAEPAKKVQNNP